MSQLSQVAYSRVRALDGLVLALGETEEWCSVYGLSLLKVVHGFEMEVKVKGGEWHAEHKEELARKRKAKKDQAQGALGRGKEGGSNISPAEEEEAGEDGDGDGEDDEDNEDDVEEVLEAPGCAPPRKRMCLGSGFTLLL